MNVDELALGVAAAAFVAGVFLVWSGWFHVPSTRIRSRVTSPGPVLVAAVVALGAFAVTGWWLSSLIVGVLVGWGFSRFRRRDRIGTVGAVRVEALASWVENVRDVLQAASNPVPAIGLTTDTAPPIIRDHVLGLYSNLSAGMRPELAFRRFADDVDDPLADLVAVGLLIAVTRGGSSGQVLSELAVQARELANRRRLIDAERAPVRFQVLGVSFIMCVFLAGIFVFGRVSYLSAYASTSGQVALGTICCGYAALLVRVGRLARFSRPARFLTLRGEPS